MKKTLAILMTILCVLSVFTGCAKKEAPAPAEPVKTETAAPAPKAEPAKPAPAPAPAPKAEAKAEPKAEPAAEKVVFRIANGAEPESLDRNKKRIPKISGILLYII